MTLAGERRKHGNVDMKQSQSDRILQFLNENGSISQREAYTEFGIMRLAARIAELKRIGYKITSALETHVNRYGEKVRCARYTLHKDSEPA